MFRDPFGSKRIETDRGCKGRKRTRECAAARRMGKKGTRPAAAGSKASTERSGGSKKRSRADAQQENDREARAQTLGELKRIIEASGIRQVREAAFKANEFRDLLGHWQTRLRGLGVTQERDGLCFPKSAKIAFDMGTQQGGAACKHTVEYWKTKDPLAAAYETMLSKVRHRNEKVKLSGPNLARSDFGAKSEEMPLMVRGGGLRTAVKTSAAVELLVGPRSDTPAHREWGPMSWHGRFGRADVNVCRGAGKLP